ncbi:thioredoxin-like protein [Neoconidiobolus thromboides FSU 785]|nr:thioredoxin-like protein [Neoconidiobolus thromboides FSU 785]
MGVININSENEYRRYLTTSGQKLLVVDFFATWCGPCQAIASPYENLSKKYANGAYFLKVDVDALSSIAQSEGVSSMPTFKIYKNQSLLGTVQGANIMEVEAIIMRHYKDVSTFSGSGNKLGTESTTTAETSYGVTNFIYSLFGGSNSSTGNEDKVKEEIEEEEPLMEEESFEVKECLFQIRLWDRSVVNEKFMSNDKLKNVLEFVKGLKGAPENFYLTTLMPRRVFQSKDLNSSLHKLNLTGKVQLVVSLNP